MCSFPTPVRIKISICIILILYSIYHKCLAFLAGMGMYNLILTEFHKKGHSGL